MTPLFASVYQWQDLQTLWNGVLWSVKIRLTVILHVCMLPIHLYENNARSNMALMMGSNVVAFLCCTISMYPRAGVCEVSANPKTQIS